MVKIPKYYKVRIVWTPLPAPLDERWGGGGGIRYFKNSCNRGNEKLLVVVGGKGAEMGRQGLVLKWGNGKFLKSLYIVGRGVPTVLFDKVYLLYCQLLLFRILFKLSPSCHLKPPPPTVLSVDLFLWLSVC